MNYAIFSWSDSNESKKLPSGNYRVQVVAGYDETGKRIVKSFTSDKEWEALKLAEDFKNGLCNETSSITVSQAIREYIDSRCNILSPSTIALYNIMLRSRLQSIMNVKILDLRVNDIQLAVNCDSEHLCRKSVKDAVSLLKSALAMQDICVNTDRISYPAAKPKRKYIPSSEKVLDAVIGTDLELPCLLAMWLSLRISEVRGLQFRDISDDGKYITIRRVKLCLHGGDVLKDTTKTVESNRVNRLPRHLKELIDRVPHEKALDFIVNRSYKSLSKAFKRLMLKNGMDITFHTLRHEFATTLNDLGVPPDYIQKLGGWSSDNVMKSVYTHTRAEKEEQYQRSIDDYFDGIIKSHACHTTE